MEQEVDKDDFLNSINNHLYKSKTLNTEIPAWKSPIIDWDCQAYSS